MKYLTVNEYADLRGCTRQYVLVLINKGKIRAQEYAGIYGGGAGGISYQIPLESCEEKVQKKYIRKLRKEQKAKEPTPKLKSVSLEELTAAERQEIAKWKGILSEWQAYRSQGGTKAERDEEFVAYISPKYPELHFSIRILQRQAKALREQGEAALIDRRGKHENHKRIIDKEVFEIFQSFYLDESQPGVQLCMRQTEGFLMHEGREELLPLPSHQTFTREIMRSIPAAVRTYLREGEKALNDKMMPHITRTYEDLNSNDIWVCDNHTFDVFVNDGEHRKPIRVYLTAFLDVRSRKFMGWYVTLNPSSDATLIALRRGIEKYGIPRRILADNGREFLTFDIGGRGFRKTKKTQEHEAPTILDNLGIDFHTAMVKNARAKIIERAFLDVKNDFSKMFEGYTGGTVLERPERLKKTGKDAENFTLLPEFIQYVDKYITGIFNKHKHRGIGMHGKTPDQVYAACLIEQRIATRDQLNLMMLRNTRMQTVGRNGVHLDLYGKRLEFNSHDLNFYHIKQKVYLRYDPDHLEEVRVYDDQDRFICTAQQCDPLGYFAGQEEVKEKMREQRSYKRMVKDWEKLNVKRPKSALEVLMWRAEHGIAEGEEVLSTKVIKLHQLQEETVEHSLAKAVGSEMGQQLDYTEGLKKIERAKG